MMRMFLAVLMIILLLSVTEYLTSQTIPIKISRNKVVTDIIIGNTVIPDIMLDTGMAYDGIMIYNPSYKDSLDLSKAIEVKIGGAGSGDPTTALMLDSIDVNLGKLTLHNQRLIVLQSDIYKGFPTNGLTGYSIFGHYTTEINYDDEFMRLSEPGKVKPDSTWKAIPLYFKDNQVPWIDIWVRIGDEPSTLLSAYIDFASEHSIELLLKPDMKFSEPEKSADTYLGTGLSGDIYGSQSKISELSFGNYKLTDIEAAFLPAKVRSKQKEADAIIGSGALWNFNLIFDYSSNTLYMKPNKRYK